MAKKIVQQEEPVLHKIAEEVPIAAISSPKIQKILKEMNASLVSQDDGVAIAAPQIGHSVRIFIVAGKIFSKHFARDIHEEGPEMDRLNQNDPQEDSAEDEEEDPEKLKDLVFINPVISKLSRDKEWLPEGCLSVRWLYGKTFRSKKATVTAYDEHGKKFTRGGSGLLAQIFQHETDHLNGILFIDHAKDIKEELPK